MLVSIGDVVDGVLVSAIAVAGRRISVAVDGLRADVWLMTSMPHAGSRPTG